MNINDIAEPNYSQEDLRSHLSLHRRAKAVTSRLYLKSVSRTSEKYFSICVSPHRRRRGNVPRRRLRRISISLSIARMLASMLTFAWKYIVTAKGTFIHTQCEILPGNMDLQVLHRMSAKKLSDRAPFLTSLLRLREHSSLVSSFVCFTERFSIAFFFFPSPFFLLFFFFLPQEIYRFYKTESNGNVVHKSFARIITRNNFLRIFDNC